MKKYIPEGIALLCSFLIIFLFRRIPAWSTFYAETIYPFVRSILNGVSSLIPFSLYDVFIVCALIGILAGIVALFIRHKRKKAFFRLAFCIGWLYVAFYFVWGINYFAPGFLQRNELGQRPFEAEEFDRFLTGYTANLNASYAEVPAYDDIRMDSLIRQGADQVYKQWKFPSLPSSLKTKKMLFGETYAAMGIRGYYGPFFAEAHVNPLYLPHERPAVAIHELGHLTGITSEAEANLFAYLITTSSADPGFRFSGYYSVLPYVLSNARTILSEEAYTQYLSTIDPRILELYKQSRKHWSELYSEGLGNIQDKIYEMYLKNNNIPSGQANYSEVIGLLMAIQDLSLHSQPE